jgi:hypothetical protein
MSRRILLALFCVLLAVGARAQPSAAPASPPAALAAPEDFSAPEARARQLWRRDMAKKSAPAAGCYSATFPSTEWQSAPCSTAPGRPHPARLDQGPQQAGAGNSPVASPARTISSATGLLAKVAGVTSEADSLSGANAWSLQLNTNRFDPAILCAGQHGCKGWQQFIADNPGDTYIQYWLIGHGQPCPPRPAGFPHDWGYFAGDPTGAPGCWINGHQTAEPHQTAATLQGMRLTGTASSAAQTVLLETGDGRLFAAQDAGDPLTIGSGWNQSEFNLFGFGGGTTAVFNAGASGASIVVRIDVDTGDVGAPDCKYPVRGFTAEKNNLNPILPCAGYVGQAGLSNPGVQFTEDLFAPIAGCAYTDTTAVCTPLPGSNFADATFTATCPAAGASVQVMDGGEWRANLPLHCSDGKLPGRCGPGATVANQYAFDTQRYGLDFSGFPIGSTQTVGVCNNASQCSRFKLTIPECASVIAAGDSFQLSDGNNPIEVTAGGAIDANLVMDGPWVSFDHGAGAPGFAFDTGRLPPGSTVLLSKGVSGAPHTYGLMDVNVSTPPGAPPGDYNFQVRATDIVSNVSLTTTVPVRIIACKPTNICKASLSQLCGPVSDGCGGSVDCGACASGVCSSGVCCPKGWFYNTDLQRCAPNTCPAGTSFCVADNACETDQKCDQMSPPVCHKVAGHLVCE